MLRYLLKLHFPKIDRTVERLVYWATFFVLLWSAMSWIAAYIPGIAHYGWAVIIFAGLGVACIVMWTASTSLIAWRYFKPIEILPAPGAIAAGSGERQTPISSPISQQKVSPVTSPYEVPGKLAMIDEAINVLDNDFLQLTRESNEILQSWQTYFERGNVQILADNLSELGYSPNTGSNRFLNLVRRNAKFEDIRLILTEESYKKSYYTGLSNMYDAVKAMTGAQIKNYSFFMQPYANDFSKGVNDLAQWRNRKKSELLELRKVIVQG